MANPDGPVNSKVGLIGRVTRRGLPLTSTEWADSPMSIFPDSPDDEASRLDEAGTELYRSLSDFLAVGLSLLPDKPEETADGTLRALWHLAGGKHLSVRAAAAQGLAPLDDNGVKQLRRLIDRRLAGEPLAYLTGRQHFMGLEMLASPSALIPRQETELLAKATLGLLGDLVAERGHARVLDVCTGSGNVALALAHAQPAARVYASDLSPEAVGLAQSNAEFLGLAERVQFRTGDLLAPFETGEFFGSVDLLTCNPPYISTKKLQTMPAEISMHEPQLAFDGGPLGVRILQRLLREAPRFLCDGGWLAFEVGLGQGSAVRKRLEASADYASIAEVADGRGDIRVLLAKV